MTDNFTDHGSDPQGRRAVALLSGGLDSGVALGMWLQRGGRCDLALCVDYGQPAAPAEARASRSLAARFDVPWQELKLPWLGDAARSAGSALAHGGGALPELADDDPGDDRSAAAVWVPARNVVLVAAAAALAEARGADCVVVGFNREEAATFADNSLEFVEALQRTLALGTRSGVSVASPTLELDKRGIVTAARQLGLTPRDFWSCYRAGGDPTTCHCESCVRSRRAWTGTGVGSSA